MSKKTEIQNAYQKEHTKYFKYIPSGYDVTYIEKFLNEIVNVNYEHFALELSPTCFKVSLIIKDFLVMLSQAFDDVFPKDIIIITVTNKDTREYIFTDIMELKNIKLLNNL